MRRFILSFVLALAAAPVAATDYQAQMAANLAGANMEWLADPALVASALTQNAETAGYSEAEIITMDEKRYAQLGTADTSLIDGVLGNATADFLLQKVAASGGAITEIILMDAQGLNVAVSHTTSDYWQGDEAKHQDTYGIGPDAVHYGDVELDESSRRYQVQISVTLMDPAAGEAIGFVTIGVDAQALS